MPLTRDVVVDASLGLAREHGLDGVTMRAVASELDVTPMALYYHVKNKDELIQLIADRVLADASPLDEPGDEPGDDWEAPLRDYLITTWEVLVRYPGLAGYMVDLPTQGTTERSFTTGTAFFERIGLPRRVATLVWSFSLTYLHGRLSIDARLDREAAGAAGLDTIPAREHLAFGVEAVILAIRGIMADPELVDEYSRTRPRRTPAPAS